MIIDCYYYSIERDINNMNLTYDKKCYEYAIIGGNDEERE